jgi:hypothetical protein
MKKRVGSGVGSAPVSQRYGFADPDPYKNVTYPEHSQTSADFFMNFSAFRMHFALVALTQHLRYSLLSQA